MADCRPGKRAAVVILENVSKVYAGQPAVAPVSLELASRRITVLIGPSGCGKSTLLRMIVGLVPPDTGRVLIDGEAVTEANLLRLRHRTGYVIQEGGLFPHLTVRDNVALLAVFLERDRSWIAARIAELSTLVQLPPALLDRYPRELSGGQRQRVSIMRALML